MFLPITTLYIYPGNAINNLVNMIRTHQINFFFGNPAGIARQIQQWRLTAGAGDHQFFKGGGVCLYTMAGAMRGAEYLKWGMQRVPPEWYGHIAHSHRAIDDARGFANVLAKLFSISQGLEKVEATESVYK